MQEGKLTQIARIIKNHAILIIGATLVAIILPLSLIGRITNIKTPPYGGVKWQGSIIPNQTNTEDLVKQVGNPTRVEGNTYFYPTNNEYRQVSIELSNDTVELVKEPVIGDEKGSLQDYMREFGQPDKLLYGEHETAAPGHLWSAKGVIVFANPLSGLILEIWYFAPTDPSTFSSQHPELRSEPESDRF